MSSQESSRVNLALAQNPWMERSCEESALIWRLTLHWWLGGREGQRNPRSQRAWAAKLGVSQPYIAKMVRRIKRDWIDMAGRWRDDPSATLEDLRRIAEIRNIASEPCTVPLPDRLPQQPKSGPAWARYSTVPPDQIDAAILAYVGVDRN